MLTASRVIGVVVLVKAVDVAAYGSVPVALLLAGSALVLALRGGRVAWAVVAVAAVAVAAQARVELTWQHTVLLAFVGLAGAVARDAAERLVLWRVQLSVLYGVAAVAKLNASFLGGDVLAGSLRDGPLPVSLPLPALLVAGVGVVLLEALLAVAPWVPRFRRPALGVAVVLHVGALVALPPAPLVGMRLLVFGGLAVALCAVSAGVLADR